MPRDHNNRVPGHLEDEALPKKACHSQQRPFGPPASCHSSFLHTGAHLSETNPTLTHTYPPMCTHAHTCAHNQNTVHFELNPANPNASMPHTQIPAGSGPSQTDSSFAVLVHGVGRVIWHMHVVSSWCHNAASQQQRALCTLGLLLPPGNGSTSREPPRRSCQP